jgi:hypothetical protein
MALPQPADRAVLVQLFWEMYGRDGRIIRCGLYDTGNGRELLAGYDDGWLWRAPATASLDVDKKVEEWRQAVLSTGAFRAKTP